MNKGAFGDGLATYFSDPDGNALEIKKYSEMQPWNSDVPSDADVIPITSRG
jgi:catechol-2,3-dioxygenase